jgi:hypothetical protein
VCPNNRTVLPKRRKKGGKEEPVSVAPECSYIKELSGPLPGGPKLRIPDPEKTRPVVEGSRLSA